MPPPIVTFGRKLAPPPPEASDRARMPDWAQASPPAIERTLARALARPSGGWYVVDASYRVTERPTLHRVADRELVAWRASGCALVAPNECPHMGAPLCHGAVRGAKLVCPWHGLELDDAGHGKWRPFATHDDGVLVWARLDDGAATTDAPILAARPAQFIAGVIRVEATCEPADVLANRFDPWHGVHFHGHSFARLTVLEANDDDVTVRVAYRVAGPLCVEVDARFHSPEPRTIVMTIVGGDGAGSVVETHATPISATRTAIIEATLATSDRTGFGLAVRAGRVLRPFIERRALRLWVDDAAYAERRYALRAEKQRSTPRTRA